MYRELSEQEKLRLAKRLEQLGIISQRTVLWSGIPADLKVRGDKEEFSRFLLLVAALDQQVEWTVAWQAARDLYDKYGRHLLFDPDSILDKLGEAVQMVEETEHNRLKYRVKVPGSTWMRNRGYILARLAGFFYFIKELKSGSLSQKLGSIKSFNEAKDFLKENVFVSAALDEKVMNMYLSWIGHPDLDINVPGGKWGTGFFGLSVDGHSATLISRTGMLKESDIVPDPKILEKGGKVKIVASKMRPVINRIIGSMKVDTTMVDFAAFFFGKYCCDDIFPACNLCLRDVENRCEIKRIIKTSGVEILCDGKCPLSDLCAKNIRWVGYRQRPRSTREFILQVLFDKIKTGSTESEVLEEIKQRMQRKVSAATIKKHLYNLLQDDVIKAVNGKFIISTQGIS